MQLLGGRVGARARVDEVDAPRLLYGEREHEVLDPDVRHVSRARDVQVLQRRAVLPWEERLSILTSIKAMLHNIWRRLLIDSLVKCESVFRNFQQGEGPS